MSSCSNFPLANCEPRTVYVLQKSHTRRAAGHTYSGPNRNPEVIMKGESTHQALTSTELRERIETRLSNGVKLGDTTRSILQPSTGYIDWHALQKRACPCATSLSPTRGRSSVSGDFFCVEFDFRRRLATARELLRGRETRTKKHGDSEAAHVGTTV